MALTIEMLKQIDGLELSDEMAQQIADLSKRDEQVNIDKITERIHSQYDADIKELTGKEKPGGVKSYDNLKQVLGAYVNDLDALKAKNKELVQSIEAGKGSETQMANLKADLETVQNEKAALEEKIQGLTETHQTALSEKDKEVESVIVNSIIDNRLADYKFKDDKHITDRVKQVMIKDAKAAVLSQNKKLVKGEDGSHKLVFLGEDGLPQTNPNNLQNPLSVDDILKDNLGDILEGTREQKGGGGKPGSGGGAGGTIQITAQNKIEADSLINEALRHQGLQPGTEAYTKAYQEAYTENNVSELPAR